MGKILDGKLVAQSIKDDIKEIIGGRGEQFSLTIFQVGDNPASNIYVKNKEKACKELGIKNYLIKCNNIEELGKKMNTYYGFYENDLIPELDEIGGPAMVQAPFSDSKIEEQDYFNIIAPYDDVDCLSEVNLGRLVTNRQYVAPCTAKGIMDLLSYYNIPVEGKNVVIVGRSTLVGKPTALLMLNANATVTICHSYTKNLSDFTSQADILVVAVGKPKFITADMVKEGAVVIDVGINRVDGKLCGDVDFENVKDKASAITPVPGGVGAMTVAELMKNTVKLNGIE